MAILGPIALFVLLSLVGIVWETKRHWQRETHPEWDHRNASVIRRSRKRAEKRGEKSVIVAGLWRISAPLLFTLDVLHPLLCRTLCGFFSCRDLGSAGWWLEADVRFPSHFSSPFCSAEYLAIAHVCSFPSIFWRCQYSVQCRNPDGAYTEEYAAWRFPVAMAAILYSFGLPSLFIFIVHRNKDLAIRDRDTVVISAISWMYRQSQYFAEHCIAQLWPGFSFSCSAP